MYHGVKLETKPSMDIKDRLFVQVVKMYTREIVNDIQSKNVGSLRRVHDAGTNLQCDSRFSETLIHLVCRRSRFDLVLTTPH